MNNCYCAATGGPKLFNNSRIEYKKIDNDINPIKGKHIVIYTATSTTTISKSSLKNGMVKIKLYCLNIKKSIEINFDGWINTNLFYNHLSNNNIITSFASDGALLDKYQNRLFVDTIGCIAGPEASSSNHRSYVTFAYGRKWKEDPLLMLHKYLKRMVLMKPWSC